MSEDKRILRSTLETARQELIVAQARVAELEARLSEGEPPPASLLETEDQYHHALDNMLDGCQIFGFDWRYLYVNDAAARYGRQSKDELLGQTVMERYPGIEDTEMFAAMRRCMEELTAQDAEFEFTYSDNSKAWFEFQIKPVPEGIIVVTHDISERKQAEEAILRSEERFHALFDTMTEGVAVHKLIRDESGTPKDYRIIGVNPAFVSHTGILRETAIGKLASDLYAVRPPPYFEIYLNVVATGQATSFDTYFAPMEKHFSISVFSIGEDGFATVFEDITERRRAEENIQKLHRTLGVLSDINQAIVRIRQMPELFQQVCQVAVERGDFLMAWVGLLDPTTRRVKPVARSGVAEGGLEVHQFVCVGELRGRGAAARALRAGAHVVCNDIAHDSRTIRWRRDALRLGYRASAAFPLKVTGEVRGTLNLYASEIDFFDAAELRLLDEMAGDISFAMEFAEQEEQRQQAQAAVQRYAQRMEILHQIDTGLIQGGSIQTLVEAALKRLRQLIPCQRADISILDDASGEALVFAVELDGDTALGQGVRVPIPANVFEGYDARHIRVFDDFRPLQDTMPRARRLVNEGLVCALSAMLMDRERPIGVLGLFADTPGYFTVEHQEIAAEIANQLAIAMRQLRLNEELARHAVELERHVAELERANEKRRESEERFRILFERMLNGLAYCKMDFEDGRPQDFVYLEVNSAFETLTGLKDVVGKNVSDVIPGIRESDPQLFETYGRVALTGKPERFETYVSSLAMWFSISVYSPDREYFVAVFDVITERKRAEEALQESEQRLRNLIENAPVGISLARAGLTFYANPSYLHMFGFQHPDEVNGHLLTEQIAPQCREEIWERARRRERGEPVPNQYETMGVRQDGTQFPFSVSVTRINLADGPATLGFFEDISERKQAEAALRASEEKYRSLINSSEAVIALFDADGRLQYANQIAIQALHLTPETVVGKHMNELFPAPVAQHQLASIQQVIRTGEGMVNEAPNSVFGAERWYRTSVQPVRDAFGKVTAALINAADVTHFKQAEAALRKAHDTLEQRVAERTAELQEAKERVEAILNNSVDGILLVAPDLHIRQTNTSFNRLFACDTDDYFDQLLISLVISDDADHLTRILQDTAAEGSERNVEVRAVRKDGSVFDAEISTGSIKDDGLVCTIRDVTERKRAEEALRESEERFRRLVDSAPVAIVITNPVGEITLVNLQAEVLFGYDRAELVRQLVEILVPEASRDSHVRERAAYSAAPYQRSLGERANIYGRHKDGSVFPVELQLSYIDTKTGPLVMSFVVDITTRKQAEQALLEALTKERELGELKTRFVSMASHEFRTPLATILATTDTLSAYRHRLPEGQIDERLGRIREQVGRLTDIMDDVLLLARMQARRFEFNPEFVDVDALCRNVLDEFRSRPDLQHQLVYLSRRTTRQVMLDHKLIRQIVGNLVSNAIKYAPAETAITVSLDYGEEALVLKVADEGIGIPESDLGHLFEPFHRGGNVGTTPGTGLGLVITKESVELHGGTITVDSQVGVGTTFTVSIPMTAEGGNHDDENSGN